MDIFSDVYEKSADLLKTKSLDGNWSDVEAKLKQLLAADGPKADKAPVLRELRTKLKDAAKGAAKPAEAMAEEILKASCSGNNGFQDRAALIKSMKHFYFVRKKGNQKIWVVDNPKLYTRWTYDLFQGKNTTDLKTTLQSEEEVFGENNRKMMSDALQLARKWSMDIVRKLSSPDEATLKIAKRWFHTSRAREKAVNKSVATLLAGFKSICATCNSTTVIFSDRPHKRAGGASDSVYASVNAGDNMPVIYIFKLFLDSGAKDGSGQIGKLWLCALTVIHELSHKLVGTDDIQYDDDGLKPNEATPQTDEAWGRAPRCRCGRVTTPALDRRAIGP